MKKRKKLEIVLVYEVFHLIYIMIEGHSQGNEAESLSGVEQGAAAVGPVASRERNGDNPEVGEDNVEQKAEVDGEEEGGEVEDNGEHSDGELVDDVGALVVVEGDEVGEDAHDNHRRDPDDKVEACGDGVHLAGAAGAGGGGVVRTHCGCCGFLV